MTFYKISQVIEDILFERERQDLKWGQQNHGVDLWMLILSEEFGEACKEANEVYFREKGTTEYRKELIQTAAVCIAAVEALDRGFK